MSDARAAAWNRAIDDDLIRAVPVSGVTYSRMQQSFNAGYDIGHAAGVVDGRRQAHEIIVAVLQGQGIALDSELDNWTFHAPFWAIERALDPEGPQ